MYSISVLKFSLICVGNIHAGNKCYFSHLCQCYPLTLSCELKTCHNWQLIVFLRLLTESASFFPLNQNLIPVIFLHLACNKVLCWLHKVPNKREVSRTYGYSFNVIKSLPVLLSFPHMKLIYPLWMMRIQWENVALLRQEIQMADKKAGWSLVILHQHGCQGTLPKLPKATLKLVVLILQLRHHLWQYSTTALTSQKKVYSVTQRTPQRLDHSAQ